MKEKIQIIIFGSKGRMGQEVQAALAGHPGAEFYAGIDRNTGNEILNSLKPNKNIVAIDFSSPRFLGKIVTWCLKNKIPLVSGTTGISASQRKSLRAAARRIPILWSPNMSIGIHILISMIESVAGAMGNYDLQLEEIHHRAKKDRPSGTAKLIQEKIQKKIHKKLPTIMVGRGGGIFGIHKLWIMGDEEIISIEHSALNRKVFARGAIVAALELRKKQKGLFEIKDLWQ